MWFLCEVLKGVLEKGVVWVKRRGEKVVVVGCVSGVEEEGWLRGVVTAGWCALIGACKALDVCL